MLNAASLAYPTFGGPKFDIKSFQDGQSLYGSRSGSPSVPILTESIVTSSLTAQNCSYKESGGGVWIAFHIKCFGRERDDDGHPMPSLAAVLFRSA